MTGISEAQFKVKVQKELSRLPRIWFFKTQLVSLVGIPDIIGVCNGVFFAWELKKVGGKPTKMQLHVLKKINKAGGEAQVVYPTTLEIALEALTKRAFPERIEPSCI